MAKWNETSAKYWRLANLANVRKMHGKTQEQVARDIDVPVGTYRSWEQQKSSPTASRLARLALYFGCSADDLIMVGSRPGDMDLQMIEVPVYGEIAAGEPIEMQEVELHAPVPARMMDQHPRAFLLRVVGDSVNRRILDGHYALVDPDEREPTNDRDLYAVCVNGDSATIKRYRALANGCELVPDSYDPTFRPKVYDGNEDDTPEVTIIGKVVYAVMPLDFEI